MFFFSIMMNILSFFLCINIMYYCLAHILLFQIITKWCSLLETSIYLSMSEIGMVVCRLGLCINCLSCSFRFRPQPILGKKLKNSLHPPTTQHFIFCTPNYQNWHCNFLEVRGCNVLVFVISGAKCTSLFF